MTKKKQGEKKNTTTIRVDYEVKKRLDSIFVGKYSYNEILTKLMDEKNQ
jgi:predicted CopG family antitoxin